MIEPPMTMDDIFATLEPYLFDPAHELLLLIP